MEIAHKSVTIFKGGVDMVDYREILRLNSQGYSRRRISSMVGSSHHTADQTLAAAECSGIKWPLDDDITNEELQSIMFPGKYAYASPYTIPDFVQIHRALAKPGVTLTLLHEEYKLMDWDNSISYTVSGLT